MRKIILAAVAAATLAPTIATAQSYGEARRSQREVLESRRDLNDARRYGDRRDVREARQELREDRREAREDWRDYRRTHGDIYRRPAYVGPRGYRYRPVTVGYRFAPNYYGLTGSTTIRPIACRARPTGISAGSAMAATSSWSTRARAASCR